jgi:sarcosine oxidase
MGSAACYQLAKRGQKVLGIEQYQVAHDRGSSHGETRLIRQAYFENPSYVPLLFRAYELWLELGELSQQELLVRNGLVIYGRPGVSQVYEGTLRSAGLYNIPFEKWDHAEGRRRQPIYQLPEGYSAVFEPGAGFLHAERSVKAHVQRAIELGAEIHEGEKVLSYRALDGGVVVKTDRGEYSAARLVIAGGSWSSDLMRELGLPLTLRRMLLGWFRASEAHALDAGAPCFIFDLDDDFYYGFPRLDGRTMKMASHRGYEVLDSPEQKDDVPPSEARIDALRGCIRRCMPGVTEQLDRAAHCIYTMTPDEDFVIDLHPEHPQISYAAGFSGHGFKFSSVIGEILADLATEGKTGHPIGFLRASRFK